MQWIITLHNKWHMIPRFGEVYGSSYTVVQSLKETYQMNKVYEISKTMYTRLNEKANSCDEKHKETNLESCLNKFITNKLNCTLPWLTTQNVTLSKCNDNTQYLRFVRYCVIYLKGFKSNLYADFLARSAISTKLQEHSDCMKKRDAFPTAMGVYTI
jgi:hypothetical protein